MSKLFLILHVLAAILAIGPVAVAASMFPPALRSAQADPASLPALRNLHRICRVYAVFGIAVPVFGFTTASSMGVLGDTWLIISIVLTAAAAAVLALLILPRQNAALAAVEGAPPAVNAESAPPARQTEGAPLATRAVGAPPAGQAEGAPPAGQAEDAPPAVNAEGALHAVNAEGAPAAVNAEGAPAAVNAEGAPAAVNAEGALPAGQAEGALPAGQAEGALPAGQAEGAPADGTDIAPVAARLAMFTGVFNVLWAVVTILMIVRPGSTTGA
ncbi:hypothetical protein SMC26_36330 [Actinomadura fulvescens]|uniref:Integral membrane protein n=1 Tax=Actinomadura fulvescens TaxID=46160 RepID=A0ABN3P8X5_9ACTN